METEAIPPGVGVHVPARPDVPDIGIGLFFLTKTSLILPRVSKIFLRHLLYSNKIFLSIYFYKTFDCTKLPCSSLVNCLYYCYYYL
jgi:hypothetical protein